MTARDLIAVCESISPMLTIEQRRQAARVLAALSSQAAETIEEMRRRHEMERSWEERQLYVAGDELGFARRGREP
jgi:ribosome recycling factor